MSKLVKSSKNSDNDLISIAFVDPTYSARFFGLFSTQTLSLILLRYFLRGNTPL